MAMKIKRRHTGAAGAPPSLLSGQFAINDVDGILYIGLGDDGSGNATSIAPVGGAAFILASLIGAASGVAPLDLSGKVPVANLPSSVVGAMNYAGTWNASTNSPALASGVGTKGTYYKVSTAGTTAVDGTSQWNVGDIIVFDGTTWDKIDGIASEVISVAGRTGAVTLAVADVSGAAPLASPALTGTPTAPTAAAGTSTTQLATTAFVSTNFTRTAVADAAYTVLATDRTVAITTLTAARVLTLPASSAFPAGSQLVIIDESGACSATNTITVNRAGTDTINGASSAVIATGYGYIALESNHAGKWTIVDSVAPIQSVAGRTGAVTLAVADVSGAAPLASPALTGTPTAPTAAAGTSTTQIASTAFVETAVSSTAPLASPAFTGTPTAPTAATGTSTTQVATTAFVSAAVTSAANTDDGTF